ncbi:MAG TPA: T9SS type A sorting domain-containing protein [Bacteroidia bacterium]|nr:T9SS type A sorting domain-containing protein [Bacteroidia bacterium]
MKKILLALFIALLCKVPGTAQTFCSGYGTPQSEFCSDVCATPDHGFVTAGSTQTTGTYNILVVKYDSAGTVMWNRTLGGPADDHGMGITIAANGDILVTCWSMSYGTYASGECVYTVRLSQSGTVLWTKGVGGMQGDVGFQIAATPDNGCVITGFTASFPFQSFNINIYIVKLDSTGKLLWGKSVVTPGWDVGYDLAVDAENNIILSGVTVNSIAHPFLIKLNSEGSILWKKEYTNVGADHWWYGKSVCVQNDAYYVTGFVLANATSPYDHPFLMKLDTGGNALWVKILGASNDGQCFSICPSDDGNLLLSGYSGSSIGLHEGVIIQTDTSGTVQWACYTGMNQVVAFNGICQQGTGNYVAAGTASILYGPEHQLIMQIDQNGNSCCGFTYSSLAGFFSAATASGFGYLDEGGEEYTGGTTGSAGNATLICGLTLSTENDPVNENIFQVSPNPATDMIHLTTSKPVDKYEIYNALGQIMSSEENCEPGSAIDISAFPRGQYILRIQIEGEVYTTEFIAH